MYDLSTLCTDMMEDINTNPFTVPVGILLYRVARNMRQNTGRKKSGTIRTLLTNALLLLDQSVHSQVCINIIIPQTCQLSYFHTYNATVMQKFKDEQARQ